MFDRLEHLKESFLKLFHIFLSIFVEHTQHKYGLTFPKHVLICLS